jgi:hypothetical protein
MRFAYLADGRTRAADTILVGLFEAGKRARRRVKRQNPRAACAPVDEEIMLTFALTGAAVLAGRPYSPFFHLAVTAAVEVVGVGVAAVAAAARR